METLNAIFVGAVLAFNSLIPQANLPKVLGVQTQLADEETSVNSTMQLNLSTESSLSDRMGGDKKAETFTRAKQKREELQKQLQTKREFLRERLASKEAENKKKLEEITDERKQKIVENVISRLANLNEKWTTHANNVLTRLTEILTKIESRVTELADSGKDTTQLTAAIATAKVSIANAQGSVTAQSTKTYTISVSTEENLRVEVQAVTSQFKSDIRATLSLVKTARESVRKAFVEMSKLTGEDVTVESEVEIK